MGKYCAGSVGLALLLCGPVTARAQFAVEPDPAVLELEPDAPAPSAEPGVLPYVNYAELSRAALEQQLAALDRAASARAEAARARKELGLTEEERLRVAEKVREIERDYSSAVTVPAAPPAPVAVAPAPVVATPASGGVENAPITRMRQDDAVALVIGIETYRGTIPPAEFAEADAKLYARYLERTLGVKRENIQLLLGDRASKSDIEAAIDEWLPRHAKAGAPVYFYYSGHGAPDPQSGDSYLVPWDGDPEYLKSKALPLPRVYDALARTKGKVFAVVDSCFSGLGGHSLLARGLRPLVPVREVAPTSGTMAVLSASTSAQVTGASRTSAHGLFTFHVLRGLAGAADRDGDRAVSLNELDVFVRRNVEADARDQNREQSPRLHLSGGKPGEWIVVDGLVE